MIARALGAGAAIILLGAAGVWVITAPEPLPAAMIEGPVSARCPASALQMHPRATVVLDPEAAARLELRQYYETVHPQGREVPLG